MAYVVNSLVIIPLNLTANYFADENMRNHFLLWLSVHTQCTPWQKHLQTNFKKKHIPNLTYGAIYPST